MFIFHLNINCIFLNIWDNYYNFLLLKGKMVNYLECQMLNHSVYEMISLIMSDHYLQIFTDLTCLCSTYSCYADMRKLSQIYIVIRIFPKFDTKLDRGLTWWILVVSLTSFFFWKSILAAFIFVCMFGTRDVAS